METNILSTSQNTSQNSTIVFTGGGTGGHIYPNLALIDEFEKRGYKAIYIGGNNSLEQQLAQKNNIRFFGVDTIKLIRSINPSAIKNNLNIPFTLKKSVANVLEILKQEKPCAVISKGGFASLPSVLASSKLNIPVFAHESDLTLGLANKVAMHKGATILKANPNAKFEGTFVGMPLRKSLLSTDKRKALQNLGIHTNKQILFILGGSSGAQAINDVTKENIDRLCAQFFVLHICGKGKSVDIKHKDYKCFEYADNIQDFYAVSDVVVSRAGATAVFELSALKKRCVFIPLPKGVSRGDQIDNAMLAKQHGALVLYQDDRLCDNFLPFVQNALKNPPMTSICDNSNGKIADIVCDRLRRGEICKNKKQSQNGSPSYFS